MSNDPAPPSDSFPDRLRKIREDKGLSQGELASATGLQPSAVSHFEAGRRSPSFDNLAKLADALGVSIDFLLGRPADASLAGPEMEELFRHAEKMSKSHLGILTDFAKVLAQRNAERAAGGATGGRRPPS